MLKKIIVFTLLVMTAPLLPAQQPADNLVMYQLTEQNGLSDNQVTCFFQDSRGFMWIGTKDGLNLYDGSAIRVFKRRGNDSMQLADNSIHAVREDAKHQIWIATDKGLSRYDPSTNSFRSWWVKSEVTDMNVMPGLAFDEEGKVWIASYAGLLKFDPDQQQFYQFANNADNVLSRQRSSNTITSILIDHKKRFWLTTFNGLWQFFPADHSFRQEVSPANDPTYEGLINTIFEDHAGHLWLGYWSTGIKQFNPDTKEIKVFSNLPNAPSNVLRFAELKNWQGNYSLWANLCEMNMSKEVFRQHVPLQPDVATDYYGAILYASKDNLLWISTDKGVRIMDPAKQFFHHHFLSPTDITSQGIALLEKDSSVYVGGSGENFLKLYDPSFQQGKIVIPQATVPKGKEMNKPAIINIVREDDHHIWLCMEEGLILLDENTKRQQLFRLTDKEINIYTRNFFSNIFIDSKRNHWVFPWRCGIWQLDVQTGKFRLVTKGISTDHGEIKNLLITAAAEDADGNIWFADLDEGLILYDHDTHTFSKPASAAFGTHYNLSNLVFEDPYIWGSKEGVVFRIHTKTKRLEQFPVPDELNKKVAGFCGDHYNHLWITTTSGLLSFDKTTHHFKRYTSNDGLLNNVMQGTLFPLTNGKIIYAEKNYLTVFDPEEMEEQNHVPPVLVTNVLSQNKPVQISSNAKGEKHIDLDYTYNNFTFNWAILNYSNPLQNQYYCRLEGVDKDWKYVGNKGEAQYASLSPGKYTLFVKGATSDGIMNETGDFVSITIYPPFWKSWWFITGVILVVSGIVYSIYRYRLNRALEMERLRMKISSDLHDDIGSTLSSISILSDMVLHDAGMQRSGEMVQEIKDNSVMLMEKMDDIVWSINPGNDSLENLLIRIKRFASRLFEAKGIDYDIHIRENIRELRLPMEFRQHIYLIMKEAINNLVKYSQCSRATIEVSFQNGLLQITIQDNGRGFDTTKEFQGNGMITMHNRANSMKARMDIQSQVDNGTTIGLQVKIK